jgi:hypothetical protein
VVNGLITPGLTILAGKPKIGKSWAALNICIAVACGGFALGSIGTDKGQVLYLALEDNKRRLKSRLAKILGQSKSPADLTLATQWPKLDKEGAFHLIAWLEKNRDAKLIAIDTWAKFRPTKVKGKDDYSQDYEASSDLKTMADHYGVAIMIVHHCRKTEASDPFDEVSGTLGLTGSADGILVLKHDRGLHDAVLHVTGRDVEEAEIALRWEAKTCLWSVLGGADEYRISKERSEIIDVLRKEARPMKPKEVAPLIGKKYEATKKLLWLMSKDGWLKAEMDGSYSLRER